MNQPLISVVIPTFNSQLYLNEAILSVVNQTYCNLQILILDDGSSDNSVLVSKNISDSRIEVYESLENKGQSFQLNRGISKSKGEYISIMHSDDIMINTKLEKQMAFLEKNKNVGVCGTNIELIGNKSGYWIYPEKNQDCKDMLLSSVPFAHPAVLIRKSVLNQLNTVYKQEMVPAEDYDLWVKLSKITDFGNVQEVLLKYRIHPGQISNIQREKERILLDEIRKNIIVELFNIANVDAPLCFNALYNSQNMAAEEVIRGIELLWESNKKHGMFSKQFFKGRLKHTVFNVFKKLSLRQRIKHLLSNPSIMEISFFKTMFKFFLIPRA